MARPRKYTRWGGDGWEIIPRQRADGGWSFLPRVWERRNSANKTNLETVRDDADAAERAAKDWLGIHSGGPVISVAALQHSWLEWKRSEHHLAKSLEVSEQRTAPFVAVYGPEPALAINREIARTWCKNRSPSEYSDLAAMFTYGAEILDVLPASPFRGKGIRPTAASDADPDLRRRSLTEPELLAVADHAKRRDGLWHEVMVLWMGYGGQRLAELVDTHVDHLLPLDANGNLRVRVETQWREEERRSRHTKGKRDGIMVLPGWLAAKAQPLIDAARTREGAAAGLLFVNPEDRRWVQQSYRYYWYGVRSAWTATLPDTHWLVRRLAKDSKRGLTSHELRHTASTIIQLRTGDLNASRAQLRHSKQAMTLTYTHPEDADGLDAVSAAYTAQVIPLRREAS